MNMWIRPLQAVHDQQTLQLYAPNPFVRDWVGQHYLQAIEDALAERLAPAAMRVVLKIGSAPTAAPARPPLNGSEPAPSPSPSPPVAARRRSWGRGDKLNERYLFANFVEGKSNKLALAAAQQVASNPGLTYNPLLIYGDTGLGKTHLMHAVGNSLREERGDTVVYQHSDAWVNDWIGSIRRGKTTDFKHFYRGADVLLIDDIQFFVGKENSQEEFFHTFNTLLESEKQVILTCDRYPREILGLEERLKSRFGSGLTVAVEPPELETRAAILLHKAGELKVNLPQDVAFFIANRVRSNVRELEGALRLVAANANLTKQPITIDFARETLRDQLMAQDRRISIDNIQRTVAEYYRLSLSELLSSKRSRTIARPRQIAMSLAKELTGESLPEIGKHFGGRDHTTVLHACRKIAELRQEDPRVSDDYLILLRTLCN